MFGIYWLWWFTVVKYCTNNTAIFNRNVYNKGQSYLGIEYYHLNCLVIKLAQYTKLSQQ